MKALTKFAVVSFILIAAGSWALAGDQSSQDAELGEKLVRQLWATIHKADPAALEKLLAQGFQSIHEDGAHDRAEELKLLAGLNLGKYTLSNIKATRNGPAVVVTYSAAAEETMYNKRLPGTPSPRMSVFLKTDQGWQWLAHANLRSLKK